LAALALFAAAAVVLLVIDPDTGPITTAYEIITFLVAIVALILAVVHSVFSARTVSELKKIISEIHQVLKAENTEIELLKKTEEYLEANDKNHRPNTL
jgi:H+/gluconate symporter-like permease